MKLVWKHSAIRLSDPVHGLIAAGAMAGLAGALLASHNRSSVRADALDRIGQAAGVVVIGGLGQRWGGPLGVAIWLTLAEVLKLYTEYCTGRWPCVILIVFFAPRDSGAGDDNRGKSA